MLINEGLRVALQQPTPDATLNFLLEYLGKLLKGDRAYIFEKNETGGDNNTYEWVAAGVTPEKEDLQDLPPEVCASWYQKFSENKHIMIEDLEKIREDDPALYHVLHKQNISSLVVVPLYDNGKAFAFYGIDNPPAGFPGIHFRNTAYYGTFYCGSTQKTKSGAPAAGYESAG